MSMGSVPSAKFRHDAAGGTVLPAFGAGPTPAAPLQLTANLSEDISSADFHNGMAVDVNVYLGPDADLTLLCVVPGVASNVCSIQRAPVRIAKGERISIGAAANATAATGRFIMNGWV